MCEVGSKYKKSTTVTGYKVVVKVRGRYYSPFTGYQYHIGTLPHMKYERNSSKFIHYNDLVLVPYMSYHTDKMYKKTGVLLDPNRVNTLYTSVNKVCRGREDTNIKAAILRMTISGDLHRAKYGSDKTMIGSHIDDFEEITLEQCTKIN